MIKIKPLSVNKCWQGRRFKTKNYLDYEKELYYQLPDLQVPSGELKLKITFGFSSRASDIDNHLKPLLDILQKKYDFNDNRVYDLNVKKQIVGKGEEFIDFVLAELEG